jgi:hypothetical protein
MRTAEARELLRRSLPAFVLAYVIAYRGQFKESLNRYDLKLGESLIGDYRNYGLTRQKYRSAVHFLAKHNFATFRPTNRGTVARLTDTRLFAIFRLPDNQQNNQQPTNNHPSGNQQITTTENDKNEKDPKDDPIDPVFVLKKVFERAESEGRPDWHSLSLEEKAKQVLGIEEMLKCGDRWRKRFKTRPADIAEILDAMRANLLEGAVIKNRGAYAEDLWKKVMKPVGQRMSINTHRDDPNLNS